MSNGYLNPDEAWFRFVLWTFVCIAALETPRLVKLILRIWIDQQCPT